MVFVVEVLAIYEDPGVTPAQARINSRNNDFADAQSRSAAVTHYVAAGQDVPAEYLGRFGLSGDEEPASRYGFGWRGRVWLNVRQDGDDIGRAIWARLTSRNLRNGSKVEVFEHRADEGSPYATGATIFARYLPAGVRDVG